MDYDGLPPATQPLALLDNRSTKQVIELLHALFRNLELNKVEPWYPLNHPDNQHHAQLLVTLADSIMKLFPRPGTPNWDPEWTQLCALSLDIQGRLLGKVAMLYDEKKTRPPEGAERMEQAWLGMLFSVLGLANAWVLDESIVLDEGERECFTVLGRKCVDVAGGMMRLLGSSLTLGDDPARPAWEVMRPCVDELVRFVSGTWLDLDLERGSLFTWVYRNELFRRDRFSLFARLPIGVLSVHSPSDIRAKYRSRPSSDR